MTPPIVALLYVAAAVALHLAAPRRHLLVVAAGLLGVASVLAVDVPCMLSAATLVALEGSSVVAALSLLAASMVGLSALASTAAVVPLSGVLTVALLVRVVATALERRPRVEVLAEEATLLALALAVCSPVISSLAAHRLAPLVGPTARGLGAALALVTVAAGERRARMLSERRARMLSERRLARHRRRPRAVHTPDALDPRPAIAIELPRGDADSDETLMRGLRRIVHELRQPIGAASNALATAKLPHIDHDTARSLGDLAATELASALASLDALACFARMGAGDPVRLPADDAVEIALGSHLDSVQFARGAMGDVSVDPAQLGHALDALVRNAQDAHEQGVVRVETAIDAGRGSLLVRVINDGEEPVAEHLHAAPLPFFSSRAGRLGLGAALASRFAESTGGSLRIERRGSSTVAELALPMVTTTS